MQPFWYPEREREDLVGKWRIARAFHVGFYAVENLTPLLNKHASFLQEMWLAEEAKAVKGGLQAADNEKSNIFMDFGACASSDSQKIWSASSKNC